MSGFDDGAWRPAREHRLWFGWAVGRHEQTAMHALLADWPETTVPAVGRTDRGVASARGPHDL